MLFVRTLVAFSLLPYAYQEKREIFVEGRKIPVEGRKYLGMLKCCILVYFCLDLWPENFNKHAHKLNLSCQTKL